MNSGVDCSAYGVETLPYGVFTHRGDHPRVGVRLGDGVVDLAAVSAGERWPQARSLDASSLNSLMSLGPGAWGDLRRRIVDLIRGADSDLPLIPLSEVTLRLPIDVGDYVDFYASESHAINVGKIFRPDSPALPPNWKHLPIGYHGRSGTVVVSGTDIVRPQGQRQPGTDGRPPFGPSTRLDIECEVGFVVGAATPLGHRMPVARARDHIFGAVLLNDWSARDIQAWEYVPLGPFLGKSFATSISAWVVPYEALREAELPLPAQEPEPLPYLAGSKEDLFGLDLHLEVVLNGSVVATPEYADMYWSPAQMLAHMTVNGASLRVGDLFASGTVSGAEPMSFGSLLERTWNGTEPLHLADGSTRGFLEDGDVVTLRGWAPGPGGSRIALGEVTGRVVSGEHTPPHESQHGASPA
jgi:fumarylacetoacetase